ncbi:MAG: hypothetical protein K6A67_02230 [Bacteroidales bacterium]|nr:hypothetical protein [Bacteroidales bacterium]
MKPSLQKYFGILRDNLSVRARHILEANKIFDYSALLKKTEKPGFTFINLKNCGKKTADELDNFVSQLLNYQKEIAESEASDTENTFYTIAIGDECLRFATDAPLKKPITDFDLSVRTINCLKHIEVETLGDLVSFNKSDLVGLRGFGEKVLQELENVVLSHGLEFGIKVLSYQQEDTRTRSETSIISSIPSSRYLSDTDIDFSYAFKDKYGHFPMAFISYRTLSFLTEYEREVLRMTIESPQPLSLEEIANKFCLTRERIRQIYDKARKRIKASGTIEQLFKNEDWGVYGVGEDVSFVFSSDLHIDRIIEERDFLIEYIQNRGNDDWNTPNITESSLYFVLVMKGMIPLWIDQVKKELSSYYIASGQTAPFFFVDDRLYQYKFNKAIREVHRLQKIRKTESIFVPITSYFIDNNCYLNGNSRPGGIEIDKLKELLIRVLQVVCGILTEGECIVFEYNKVDYGNMLYELLKRADARLHRDELLQLLANECFERGLPCEITDSSQLTTFLSGDSRIISIGKSGYWGLKEWGEITGSIRNIAVKIVQKSKEPIQIEDLANRILLHRPDSAFDNVTTIIRQSVYMGEFVLFFDDYIGLKGKKYNDKYVIYPTSFGTWVDTYRQFVKINKRLPYCGQKGYEGYLYRWHYKASQLTDLSTEEILKFDALEKELAHYPQNATEYNFLQNCNLYKKFVESNKRMLTKEDDSDLFNWFYKYSRSYSSLDDNRNKYFGQLLQYISKVLY